MRINKLVSQSLDTYGLAIFYDSISEMFCVYYMIIKIYVSLYSNMYKKMKNIIINTEARMFTDKNTIIKNVKVIFIFP